MKSDIFMFDLIAKKLEEYQAKYRFHKTLADEHPSPLYLRMPQHHKQKPDKHRMLYVLLWMNRFSGQIMDARCHYDTKQLQLIENRFPGTDQCRRAMNQLCCDNGQVNLKRV